MGRILIGITGQMGITNATLELGRRLAESGHDVHVVACRDRGEVFAACGIRFTALPLPPLEPPREYIRPGRGWRALLRNQWNGRRARRLADERTYPRQFIDLLAAEQPQLLIIDTELHEYVFTAYARGVPLLLLSAWFTLYDDPGTPPLTTPWIPATDPPDEVKAAWPTYRRLRRRRSLRNRWYAAGADRRSTLERLRRREGFPDALLGEELWPGHFTYRNLPLAVMNLRELDFPHPDLPYEHYVGPMVRRDRPDRDTPSRRGHTLESVYERVEREGVKLIVCTVSSQVAVDAALLKRVIRVVGRHPEWILVVGLGGRTQLDDPDLPDNCYLFGYLPLVRVLRRAHLSINHGGIHSINEALVFGVPQLIYHVGMADMPGCAARVQWYGNGLRGETKTDDEATIERSIVRLLEEPGFRQRAERLRDLAVQYATQRKLEKLVDRLMRPNDGRKTTPTNR